MIEGSATNEALTVTRKRKKHPPPILRFYISGGHNRNSARLPGLKIRFEYMIRF